MYATLEMTPDITPDLPTETDESLFLRFRATGDRAVFEQVVHRFERELFSYLRRYLGDAELAEDAFQATFLQVYLKRDQFEEGRKFRPWLYAVATNQAIDAQRRNRRHRLISLDRRSSGDEQDAGKLGDLLVSSAPDPAEGAFGLEQREWVREAVDRLPETLRSVIHLVYYQGLKYRDAADVLGVPVGTIKSRMHAAVIKLNEFWKRSHND